MFGKRSEATAVKSQATPSVAKKEEKSSSLDTMAQKPQAQPRRSDEPSEEYYETKATIFNALFETCLLYTSPSPRDATLSRMPSSA